MCNFLRKRIQTKGQEGVMSWESPQLQWWEQRKGSLSDWWTFRASAENECDMVSMLQSCLNLPITFPSLWTTRHVFRLLLPWQDSAASFSFEATCCSSLFFCKLRRHELDVELLCHYQLPTVGKPLLNWLFLFTVFQTAWRGSLVQIFLLCPAWESAGFSGSGSAAKG